VQSEKKEGHNFHLYHMEIKLSYDMGYGCIMPLSPIFHCGGKESSW
jgi:hypothetical protein